MQMHEQKTQKKRENEHFSFTFSMFFSREIMSVLDNPSPNHPVLNDISGHVRFVAQQQIIWLVPGILSCWSIQMKQAAMSQPPVNQVKPAAFGKGTVSSTSCLLAWYLPLSSPGFFTSLSQAEPWRGHRRYSVNIVKQFPTVLDPALDHCWNTWRGERDVAEEFHSPIKSHISARLTYSALLGAHHALAFLLLECIVLWFRYFAELF